MHASFFDTDIYKQSSLDLSSPFLPTFYENTITCVFLELPMAIDPSSKPGSSIPQISFTTVSADPRVSTLGLYSVPASDETLASSSYFALSSG
jgi:hypothetical protein